MWERSTHLSLGQGLQEDVLDETPGGPRADEEQKADGVKGRRLDEDGDDGLVQSVRSDERTHGASNLPAVQDEP